MLDKIKVLLGLSGDTAKDNLIEVLIEQAKEEAVNHCHLPEYIEALNSTVIKMVVQDYNRLGNEGITSQGYSGVSESFVDGYSKDVIAALNKHRKVRFL